MQYKHRFIILAAVILLIGGIIFYLERDKVQAPSSPQDITSTVNVKGREETLEEKAGKYEKAKEIVNPSGFINAEPFSLMDHIGKKVILVDFWTYTCINCQRTTPYLNAWHEKYEKEGLVIVGVHTPEFEFEKRYENVAAAVQEAKIKYPVVLDNDYSTWNAYANRYWPRKYLIDIDGYIVYDHIGEGAYEETERVIQKALKERSDVLGMQGQINDTVADPADKISIDPAKVGSPETYFGSDRNQFLGNGKPGTNGSQSFAFPKEMEKNKLYLAGEWNIHPEFASSLTQAQFAYRFLAKDVYLVASSEKGAELQVFLDGKPLVETRGKDVNEQGILFLKEYRLYRLIQGNDYKEHTLRIEVKSGTADVYTFTFG